MHRADEIIPRMPRGQFANPFFVAGQIIHLERQADGELWKFLLRPADFGDVFIELVGAHPPVVEVVLPHRRMVGEADFRQTDFHRPGGRIPPARRRRAGRAACACGNRRAKTCRKVSRVEGRVVRIKNRFRPWLLHRGRKFAVAGVLQKERNLREFRPAAANLNGW